MNYNLILQSWTADWLDQKTQRMMSNARLLHQAKIVGDGLVEAITNPSSNVTVTVKVDRLSQNIPVSVVKLQDVLEAHTNGIEKVTITPLNPATAEPLAPIAYATEDVYNAMQRELSVGLLSTELIPLLTNISDDTPLSLYVDLLQKKIDEAGGAVKDRMQSFLQQASIRVKTATEMADAVLSALTDTGVPDTFHFSTIGKATDTTGWALYLDFDIDFSSIPAFLESIKLKILDIGKMWQQAFNAKIDSFWLRDPHTTKFFYDVTNIFDDEYVRTRESAEDASFNNGFTRLCVASEELTSLFAQFGGSNAQAIVIPTFGATWYIFNDPNDGYKTTVAFSRHLYDKGSALNCYGACAAVGNDWDDVITLSSNFRLKRARDSFLYNSVAEYNQYLAECLKASSRLIPYGLIALASRGIANRYAQDPSGGEQFHTKWFPDININNRADFIHAAQTIGNIDMQDSVKTFVLRALSDYFLNLLSASFSYETPYQHVLLTKTLSGSFTLQDDALTVASISTAVNVTLGTVAAVVIAVGATIAFSKLRSHARTFNVTAQRAMFDDSISATEAAKIVKKAEFLNQLAGVTVGASTDVASVAAGELFSKSNDDLAALMIKLNSIMHLIDGN